MPIFPIMTKITCKSGRARLRLATGFLLLVSLSSTSIAQNHSTAPSYTEQQSSARRDLYPDQPQEEEGSFRMTRCQKLEKQLANLYVRSNSHDGASRAAELTEKIVKEGQRYKSLQRKADRRNCYESAFLFGKTLRRTRKCIRLDRQIRQAKENLMRLDDDRADARQPRNNSGRREALLDELARNRCGRRYETARRNNSFGGFFGDNGLFGGAPTEEQRNAQPDQIKPYATYRTMCVRLCDGYYFPVSFSALPSKFEQDGLACQDRCAAPTQLFVYRNPGAEIEQMISPDGGMPYSKLPNAWKFKKAFIKGCSCKVAEYKPEGELSEEAKTAQNDKEGSNSDNAGFETTVKAEPLQDLKQEKGAKKAGE